MYNDAFSVLSCDDRRSVYLRWSLFCSNFPKFAICGQSLFDFRCFRLLFVKEGIVRISTTPGLLIEAIRVVYEVRKTMRVETG